MRLSEKGDEEAMIIDKDFVRALEYGMPPTSGIGIGMDRLTMLMTGQSTIQEVLGGRKKSQVLNLRTCDNSVPIVYPFYHGGIIKKVKKVNPVSYTHL